MKPTSVSELIAYLKENRRVRYSTPETVEDRRFDRYEDGGLHWIGPHGKAAFTPLACGHTGSETGVTFDETGFAIEKFGVKLEFHYLPNER